MSKEIVLNDFITLKLENNVTNIYIKGRLFIHCKSLLFNPPENETLEKIQSIDDLEEIMIRTEMKKKVIEISPETEFWGHASNLQAWIEMNYDTNLLHRSMSFSLLKELVRVGESNAKKIFKEEIAKRLMSGHFNVIEFIFQEGYINYLSNEELESLIKEPTCPSSMKYRLGNYIEHLKKLKFHVETLNKIESMQNCKIMLINLEKMDALGIRTGDVISVFGKKESVGVAFPKYNDNRSDIILLSDALMENIEIKRGDIIRIGKNRCRVAMRVELALISTDYKLTKRSLSYIKKRFNRHPVIVGDILMLQKEFTSDILFQVIGLMPLGICIITQETEIKIKEESRII